jgi:upstream activation factor subunit UAF30
VLVVEPKAELFILLKDLLAPPADVQVTYLNLQKFLSPHYVKKEKA